jgi:hypothetical protein
MSRYGMPDCQKCPITMSDVLNVRYVRNVRNVRLCKPLYFIESRANEACCTSAAHRAPDIADTEGPPDVRTFSGQGL